MRDLENNQTQLQRLAHKISIWFNPVYYSPLVFLASALVSSSSVPQAFFFTILSTLFIAVPVLAYILIGQKFGFLDDPHIPQRRKRVGLYLVSTFGTLICLWVLIRLEAPIELLATILALLIATFIAAIINVFWKISIHTGGIVGAATVMTFLFWPYGLLTYLMAIVVGWSRITLKKHTLAQVLAGGLVAFVATVLTFSVLLD